MRRSFGGHYGNNNDSLPTHAGNGNSSGGYSSQSYGGFGYGGGSHGGFSTNNNNNNNHSYNSNGGGLNYGEPSKYNKKRKSSQLNPSMIAAMTLGLLNIILGALWWNSRGSFNSLLMNFNTKDYKVVIAKMRTAERDLAAAQRALRRESNNARNQHENRLKELQEEKARWKKERDELREKYESPQRKEVEARFKQRDSAFLTQIEYLQQAIRKESLRTVLERFGPGPHEVRITFVHNNTDYDFVIELAPVQLVPHAVHLFLEQVEHGLWSGTYFYLNSDHVLQAGPQVSRKEYDDAVAAGLPWNRASLKRFADIQLDTMSFPDYSPEYAHHEWTVGFAGRPGGPDFYINKEDNRLSHGPGGQMQHVLEEQGDSCFGRITKGKDVIENILYKIPLIGDGTDWTDFYKEPVPIVRAEIITTKPAAGAEIDMEIPEPLEIQFGRSLKDALTELEQSLIDTPNIEVKSREENQDAGMP